MATYSVPYGHGEATFHLSAGLSADVILPPVTTALARESVPEKIRQALAHPLGKQSLDGYRQARTVAIAVNDKTRPVPYDLLLPPLLTRLEALGIPDGAITFYIATGTHTPMPPEEFGRVLPQDILARYRVVSHDCDDASNLVHLGATRRGTDIWVNKAFYSSDLKIATGNIEPHHFAGFSGGSKTTAIGLGGRATITRNHIMLEDPHAMIGYYEDNPLRQDIEDMGDQVATDFALNFILSGEHEVADVLFGAPREVMQAGIPIARKICQTPVDQKYDLVIASAGGHPKDINLYQAQKAMTHASLVARPGATLVIAAACPEGTGSASYEAYVQGVPSHQAILEKFKRDGFRVGPHKSFQIALIALRFGLILVSDMEMERVRHLLLTPENDLQRAVDMALKGLPPAPKIAVLPHATSTIAIPV